MRSYPLIAASLALAAGLAAYGVSPQQYAAGRTQDAQDAQAQAQAAGLPSAPQAQPLPMGAAPQVLNAPPAVQDYDAVAVPAWATGWKHYHWSEALALWKQKGALFCDARSKAEYDQGHIPGAIPLPLGEFDKYYALYHARLRRAKHIITYCHGVGCQLSNKVAQRLVQEKKFKNVGSFFGGWPQWQEHNMPVETGGGPKP